MRNFPSLRTRGVPFVLVSLIGVALASCASNPVAEPAQQQQVVGAQSTGLEVYTGRLQLIVTDQNAAFLERATVDLRSVGRSSWRRSATTDSKGMVTIDAVPPEVEVSVIHAYGSYAQQVTVPQTGGATEIRVIIQTFGADEQSNPDNPNAGFGGF